MAIFSVISECADVEVYHGSFHLPQDLLQDTIFSGYSVRYVWLKIGSVSVWHLPPEFHCPPLGKNASLSDEEDMVSTICQRNGDFLPEM